jgi:hypothetical protein
VFEEGGLVLSKAGCVIPGVQRPECNRAGPEAHAQQQLLQQQAELIAAAGGRCAGALPDPTPERAPARPSPPPRKPRRARRPGQSA